MALRGGQASAMEYSAREDFGHDLHKIDRAALPPHRRVGGPSLRVLAIAPLGPAIFHPTTPLCPTLAPSRSPRVACRGARRRGGRTKRSSAQSGARQNHHCWLLARPTPTPAVRRDLAVRSRGIRRARRLPHRATKAFVARTVARASSPSGRGCGRDARAPGLTHQRFQQPLQLPTLRLLIGELLARTVEDGGRGFADEGLVGQARLGADNVLR